jgi:hypothetical protein
MAINYTQSFNAGEISRKMDGRSDLEIYKTGCRKLENFYVTPQGGVERRAGTTFLRYAGTDGSNPSKLIPFNFSADTNFLVEIGAGTIKIHSSDGLTTYNPTGITIPYSQDELDFVQFIRRYDTMILTHPNHEPIKLIRKTIAPTFEVSEIDYIYPPLLDKNITSTTVTPSHKDVGDTVTLDASEDIFFSGQKDSIWAIDHIREPEQRSQNNKPFVGTGNGGVMNVAFSNWSIETSGNWKGYIAVQRDIGDGNGFADYVVLGKTKIRVNYQNVTEVSAGTAKFTLVTDSLYTKGLVKITEFVNSKQVKGTVLNELGSTDATSHWSEAAFSDYRKYPKTAEFFQNRLWFTGGLNEPSTLYASVFGDIYNFLQGTPSDMSIKRTVDSPEEAEYLIGKKEMFMGTDGGVVSVSSVDTDSLITSENINTSVENSYGSSDVQPVIANDVIVYVQRNNLKLRELVYSRDSNVVIGNDLNIMSEDITGTGISQIYVQKNPNQTIWSIRKDGQVCILTYDRVQKLMGWASFKTQGDFISGCTLPDAGEDSVFVCVKRNGKYCIELFKKRKNLNWYVDSGSSYQDLNNRSATVNFRNIVNYDYKNMGSSGTPVTRADATENDDNTSNLDRTGIVPPSDPFTRSDSTENWDTLVTVTSNNHGLSTGDVIKFNTQQNWDFLVKVPFKVEVIDANSFNLESITDDRYIVPIYPFPSNVSGTYTKATNKVTSLNHLNGMTVQVVVEGNYLGDKVVSNGEVVLDEYYSDIVAGLQYDSLLKPMPIEPNLINKISQSRVKGISKIIVRFLRTKGAQVGEENKQLTNFPVLNTKDNSDSVIELKTGSHRFFASTDFTREKLIEIKQSLPYPMTVLSVTTWINAEGG